MLHKFRSPQTNFNRVPATFKVAITPTGNLNGRWYITKASNGNSFTVYSTDPGDTTQGFDWMILQEN